MDMVKSFPAAGIGISIAAFLIATSTANAVGQLRCDAGRWQPHIADAAWRFDILERWIDAIMRAESAGCELMGGQPTASPAGAMGLMQLMPKTWETYRNRLALGDDPHHPRDNILAGAAYLRDLYGRFGWPGAAAAYHAGPARYSEYLSAGRSLPPATLEYLARIDRILGGHSEVALAIDRAPDTSTVLDSSTGSAAATPPVVAPQGNSILDSDVDPPSRSALFVPLRHGARASQREPQKPPDVQTK